MDRPPPKVDFWELFAGSCNLTRLASHYDLNGLQPMDILLRQDFKDPAIRAAINYEQD